METFPITLSSGKTAELRMTSALEQMNADDAANGRSARMVYYRVAIAITKYDGEAVEPPTSDLALDALLKRIKGPDFDEIAAAYNKIFSPTPDELKKEPSPPSSG